MINITDILPERNHKVNRLHLLMALLFLALFAFPLFPLKITNIILIALSALTIAGFLIKPVPVGKTLLLNLIFVLPFVPYLIELFISGFDPVARFEFEKKLFFFTSPLIIPLFIRVSGFKNYKIALSVFAFSVTALTMYSIAVLFFKGIPFLASAYENGACILRDNFENISGLHPTYYALFALSSAFFLSYSSLSRKKFFRVICLISVALLFFTVIFLAVRIAFFAGAVLVLVSIISSKLAVLKKIILVFCAFAFLVVISFAVPSLKNRLSEIVSWASDPSSSESTVSQRTIITDCSLEVLSENLLFGTGSRYFQAALNNCFSSKGWQVNNDQNFNPHNQYLSIGINYGIVMMLVFMAFLFWIFRKIIKIPEGKYFATATILFFITESMLERQMGVYMFGLISLLLYNVNDNISALLSSER